jgi:sulfide dehydrogenase cytochrome subunit
MANKTKKLALLVGGIALGLGSIAHAADAPKPAAAPAPAAAAPAAAPAAAAPAAPPAALVSGATAEALANTCAGCHGTGGVSSGPASPTLAGTNAEYFNDIMKRYADGKAYSTIMGRIAKGFTTEEIALMADYFAKAPSPRPSRSSTLPW